MQQYVDIYSLPRHSTCFGCHAPIVRSTKTVSVTSGVRHGNGTVTSFLRGLIRTEMFLNHSHSENEIVG